MSDGPDGIQRLSPDEALRPGTGDAKALLAVWYVRKSFYWLLFSGMTAAYLLRRTDELDVDWTDSDRIISELASPLAGLILAVVVRFLSGWIALGLAYPLVRDYEIPLEQRTGVARAITKWLDRRQIAKAYRSLRWTHHVRQRALDRLGPRRDAVARLDPILDLVNVLSFVAVVVAIMVAGPVS